MYANRTIKMPAGRKCLLGVQQGVFRTDLQFITVTLLLRSKSETNESCEVILTYLNWLKYLK